MKQLSRTVGDRVFIVVEDRDGKRRYEAVGNYGGGGSRGANSTPSIIGVDS
jgi:hypothetical protein